MEPRQKLLYPVLLIAALVAVILSVVAIISVSSKSRGEVSRDFGGEPIMLAANEGAMGLMSLANLVAHRPSLTVQCQDCGVVELIRPVDVRFPRDADAMGVWATLGGPDGAPHGRCYRINVRMDDGRLRAVFLNDEPSVRSGDRVHVLEGGMVRMG